MTRYLDNQRWFPSAEFYLQAQGPQRSAEDYWSIAQNLADVNAKYSQIHHRIGNDMVLLESMIIADQLEFGTVCDHQ